MDQVQSQKYLVNALSFSMFSVTSSTVGIGLYTQELSVEEFCRELQNGFVSAIGHESTAKLIEQLCQVQVPVSRISIKLNDRDKLLLIQITERLPEGKILSNDEIKQMLESNKVKFYMLSVRYAKKVEKCDVYCNNIDYIAYICPDYVEVNFNKYEALVFDL